jgi:hypothetical protein
VPERQAAIYRRKQPTHLRRGDRVRQSLRRQAADLAEHLGVHLGTQDGCCFHHVAGRNIEASQPARNDLGVAHRPRASRDANKVLHEERQASAVPAQPGQDRLRSGVQAETRSGHRGDLTIGQRRKMQAEDAAAQRRAETGRLRLVGARGEHDRHRKPVIDKQYGIGTYYLRIAYRLLVALH